MLGYERYFANRWGPRVALWACLMVCITVPGVVVLRGGSTNWLVFMLALGPILAYLAVENLCGTRLFFARYFLFAHLFLLAGIGLLISGVQSRWRRRTIGGLVLLLFLLIHIRAVERHHARHHVGTGAVAEFLMRERQPGEPVVVASPMFYLPLRYHLADSSDCFQFADVPQRVDWQGWSAIRDEDLLGRDQLAAFQGERFWVVNTSEQEGWPPFVPVPPGWVSGRQAQCREAYVLAADLMVVEYVRATAGGS